MRNNEVQLVQRSSLYQLKRVGLSLMMDDHSGARVFFMCELKLIHDKKIHFSPHQILFHSTMTKRNFILVGQSPKGSPRSIKLYGSSSILGLLEDQREVTPVAQDDWAHINRLLIGASCS